MQTLKSRQDGFSAVEIVLVLVIVALIGAAGWFVYKNQNKSTSNSTSITSSTQATTSTSTSAKPVDPTADWVVYKNEAGHYGLKYPKDWVIATNSELCGSGILLIAPRADSVGKCGSESDGEIAFVGIADSSHLCYDLDSTAFTNITKSTVVVSGITLTKQSGTTIDDTSGNGTLPKGTLEVNYCYGGSGYGFMALYDQKPTDKNVLDDFNTIVTKTLSITK